MIWGQTRRTSKRSDDTRPESYEKGSSFEMTNINNGYSILE